MARHIDRPSARARERRPLARECVRMPIACRLGYLRRRRILIDQVELGFASCRSPWISQLELVSVTLVHRPHDFDDTNRLIKYARRARSRLDPVLTTFTQPQDGHHRRSRTDVRLVADRAVCCGLLTSRLSIRTAKRPSRSSPSSRTRRSRAPERGRRARGGRSGGTRMSGSGSRSASVSRQSSI